MFRRTQDPGRRVRRFVYRAFTFYGAAFQLTSTTSNFGNSNVQSYNPEKQASRFGLFPLRSPLLWESSFLSLPAGTEMFQFPASAANKLCIHLQAIH